MHLDIRKATGALVERLPIGERVYVSDLAVLPVLRGARGAQVIVHEWNDDETRADCVIFENDKAGNGCPPATPEQCAAYTCY